eukprot:1159696-Pelagomonas_calceolata.AAC.15
MFVVPLNALYDATFYECTPVTSQQTSFPTLSRQWAWCSIPTSSMRGCEQHSTASSTLWHPFASSASCGWQAEKSMHSFGCIPRLHEPHLEFLSPGSVHDQHRN